MSDPAVEAAQRAVNGPHGVAAVRDSHAADLAITAAREALAPIREVIERWAAETNLSPEAHTLLDEIRPLVYPSEEL